MKDWNLTKSAPASAATSINLQHLLRAAGSLTYSGNTSFFSDYTSNFVGNLNIGGYTDLSIDTLLDGKLSGDLSPIVNLLTQFGLTGFLGSNKDIWESYLFILNILLADLNSLIPFKNPKNMEKIALVGIINEIKIRYKVNILSFKILPSKIDKTIIINNIINDKINWIFNEIFITFSEFLPSEIYLVTASGIPLLIKIWRTWRIAKTTPNLPYSATDTDLAVAKWIMYPLPRKIICASIK